MAQSTKRNGKGNGAVLKLARASNRLADDHGESRLPVLKTPKGEPIANMCLCSRKDFRDAVVAARAAQSSWASRSAYNRGQILYRIAEMLEGRTAQFIDELELTGLATSVARSQVAQSIDRVLYYA